MIGLFFKYFDLFRWTILGITFLIYGWSQIALNRLTGKRFNNAEQRLANIEKAITSLFENMEIVFQNELDRSIKEVEAAELKHKALKEARETLEKVRINENLDLPV